MSKNGSSSYKIENSPKCTVPKSPEFREVKLRTRRKEIKAEDIQAKLRELFSAWLFKYRTLLFDTNGMPRPENCIIPDPVIEDATKDYLRIIDEVKDYAWTTKVVRWPIETPVDADHLTVQIAQVDEF